MLKKVLYYVTHWEDWHWFAKYVLISPIWLWFCLKARSFWFFTTVNPTITFGGFIGETKQEIYKQLPPSSYPNSIYINPQLSLRDLQSLVAIHQFTFPFIAKPNVGQMGLMFRKIESMEQLQHYHQSMKVDYIIQEFVHYPVEVSVFYYRYPGASKGHITGFLKKEYLEVIGDGKSTLKELMLKYPRVQFRLQEMFCKHQSKLDTIIPDGELFQLSHALNLSRGGRLVSLEHEKDEQLLSVFDALSDYSKNFYYGRYDVRCATIEDLKKGKNFSILEFNGCGAEPHHIYHNGNNLFKACKILIEHWNILYKISEYNHRAGVKRLTYRDGKTLYKKATQHFRSLKDLDQRFEFITPAKQPSYNTRHTSSPHQIWFETENKKSA